MGSRVWNEIPERIRKLSNNSFKNKMRNILFDILITEGDYIEIDNIIAKTKEILGIPSLFCNLLYLSHHVISYLFNFRDWSKSIGGGGGGGPEHLEMWLIKNTWPTPSLRHKND